MMATTEAVKSNEVEVIAGESALDKRFAREAAIAKAKAEREAKILTISNNIAQRIGDKVPSHDRNDFVKMVFGVYEYYRTFQTAVYGWFGKLSALHKGGSMSFIHLHSDAELEVFFCYPDDERVYKKIHTTPKKYSATDTEHETEEEPLGYIATAMAYCECAEIFKDDAVGHKFFVDQYHNLKNALYEAAKMLADEEENLDKVVVAFDDILKNHAP